MGLKEVLVKLKLVELAGAGAPAHERRADPPELAELLARVPPPAPIDERKLAPAAARPAAVAPPATAPAPPPAGGAPLPGFAEIYRAGGIQDPPHGFTAFKVLEFLASPELGPLEGRARAAALATFLRMNPAGAVSIADVLEDAVRRDQALDQFEKFLQAKLAARAGAADKEIARLQAELDAAQKRLREAIDAERRALDAARVEFEAWRERKRAEEKRLHDAVAPFVEENPITRES
jgi:tetratricopeptide (TPR) repeat protein